MGLMDILNGMQNGPRGQTQPGKGGMSPLTMAMLALLAYKAYQKMGSGQPGTVPAGNSRMPTGGQISPPGGQVAQGGGGLGDILGNLGPLGGLLAGGAAGSVLSGGLSDLLKQFQQNGHGDVASSWVGTGPNQQISPHDLGRALGDDTVNSLAEQAGLSKVELLQGMSQQLPGFVDQLTPQGRVPTEDEMSRFI
ncbi:MAG: YidB family protein [Xanthobacteraceae bacterium]